MTYAFRQSPRPEGTHRRWLALKTAASRTIVEHGGTISHQHGVGRDHLPYLAVEKGELGMAALRSLVATFDPDGLMDPGVLVGDLAAAPTEPTSPTESATAAEPTGSA